VNRFGRRFKRNCFSFARVQKAIAAQGFLAFRKIIIGAHAG